MEVKLVDIKNEVITTVDELVEKLLIVPADYTINPCGESCAMAVNHYTKSILLDNPNYISEIEYETKEDAKANGDSIEVVDIPDEDLKTFLDKHAVFVVLGKDGETREYGVKGVYSTEDLAKECGMELIEAGIITEYTLSTHVIDEFGQN